jgi:serine/threonine protein kinase
MELQIGQRIGRYRLDEEISRGAYSNVYRASYGLFSERVVALKIMHTPFLESENSYDAFQREADILKPMKHPYILAVIDVNAYEGNPYIVKQFAGHGSLLYRLQQQQGGLLPLDVALHILYQIGDALHFAHQHHVVHCDIKPANILFNENEDALLSDFDIAQVLTAADIPVEPIGGSPSYMAPEQFQRMARYESDQYSLACIAYEMMTGRRPFEGRTFEELAYAHQHRRPVPIGKYNQQVPPAVEKAVLKAMHKKYAERFSDVGAFIEALRGGSDVLQLTPWQVGGQQGHRLVLDDGVVDNTVDESLYYEETVVSLPDEETQAGSGRVIASINPGQPRTRKTGTGTGTSGRRKSPTTAHQTTASAAKTGSRKRKTSTTTDEKAKPKTASRVRKSASDAKDEVVVMKKSATAGRKPSVTTKSTTEKRTSSASPKPRSRSNSAASPATRSAAKKPAASLQRKAMSSSAYNVPKTRKKRSTGSDD